MHDPGTQRLALVALYAAGALVAGLAVRTAGGGRERTFWAVTAALLLLLMAAKQLQLIDSVSRAGRAAVKAHGWYGVHRQLQDVFAIVLAAGAVVGAASVARWLRTTAAAAKLAGAALVLLAGSLVLRAISIHAVDVWSTSRFAGMRKGWWVELVAILVICAAAGWRAAHPDARNLN
jgi:hypothetical protein